MRLLLIVAALFLITGCETTPPTVQQGPNAEVTYDGLHLVNNSRSDKVWIKPDIDLSQYDQIMLESAGIQYREVPHTNRFSRTAEDFPLDERQKERLRDTVREAMTEELRQIQNYTYTDKPGKSTLKVTIGLLDVVSHIPEELGGRDDFYIRNLGSAILVVEYRDSQSNEALARMLDREDVEPVVVQESNPVTNSAEVRRIAKRWGARLRNGLDELHNIGCFVCAVPGDIQE